MSSWKCYISENVQGSSFRKNEEKCFKHSCYSAIAQVEISSLFFIFWNSLIKNGIFYEEKDESLLWFKILIWWLSYIHYYPADHYMFKVHTIETLEEGVKYVKWRRSGVFIVNFEHISCLVLVFLLLTLSR